MTEAIVRNHGLEPLVNVISQSDSGGSGICIRIDSQVGHLNLRADCSDNDCVEALESQLGQSLPTTPNTLSEGEHRIYWLGPDEWLILTDLPQAALLMEKLRKSVTGKHVALNDVSGGQIVLRLDGTGVRDLLAKGCTLDLHPRVFTAGMCAQSGLAKANVLIGLAGQAESFDIVVRRSFSDYLLRWLLQGADEFGVTIEQV